MASKPKATQRSAILERVTTPLGFFTLGILVIEAILASLSVRASGADFTILIIGMLLGFALLCGMVFVLARTPDTRHALVGTQKQQSAHATIQAMQLTDNDIRVLYAALGYQGLLHRVEEVLIDESPLPMQARFEKLKRLNLIEEGRFHDGTYSLTREGWDLAWLIHEFAGPIVELKKRDRTS